MGFSSSACYSVPKGMKTMMLFCNTGVFAPATVSYGIMPYDAEDKNICIQGYGETKECENRLDESFTEYYQHE